MSLDLLDFMDDGTASTLANALFDAKKAEAHLNILIHSRITPFLDRSRREDAERQIRDWAQDVEWSSAEISGLKSARQWLSETEFQATVERFYEAAAGDGDDAYRARNLASLLPLIRAERRDELAERLIAMASAAEEWDHGWSHVIETIVAECDPPWLFEHIHPLLSNLVLWAAEPASRLLIRLAARVVPHQHVELVDEALTWYRFSAWPLDTLVELVPLLTGERQVHVLMTILRELSAQRRVRQFRVLEALFPTLAAVGREDVISTIWESIWEVTLWWP